MSRKFVIAKKFCLLTALHKLDDFVNFLYSTHTKYLCKNISFAGRPKICKFVRLNVVLSCVAWRPIFSRYIKLENSVTANRCNVSTLKT